MKCQNCIPRQMSQLGTIAQTTWFCILIFMHFSCSIASAQIGTTETVPTPVEEEGKLPIHIESDLMEALDKSGVVVFTGHVKTTRGNLVIHSDKLEVFYEKREHETETKRAVKKTVATGHVRITHGERVGTGEQAVYDKSAEKITITGKARVMEGPSRVSGERIIFFINEDRSIVEGSSGAKVEAVIYPAE
ncbi:MAG: lipopolysaccharide transport periplasmic protein LptA [Dissulfuribacterales bacterium]